jgi:phosphomannomutase
MHAIDITCFKAYDARGRVPDELNEEIAYRIGRAYADYLRPGRVALGHDVRLTSPGLQAALARGLTDSGVDVHDIGSCGTEEVYFATFFEGLDGGIMTTASHNPMDYNGFKFVREQARPISGETGLQEIRGIAARGQFTKIGRRGSVHRLGHRPAYIEHLLSYVETKALPALKIVVNAGNGGAGEVVDLLTPHLPFEFVKINHEPDGTFPNGIPNPLLPERRQVTSDAVVASGADLGIAWDGDFDRCFFFDETGRFIEGYYIVGLLAAHLLEGHPGETIIHEPRLIWNTIEMVEAAGGRTVQSKAGHAFLKESMRREDALYGGEMSAHHFFRAFGYCDSGMIPWLIMAEILGKRAQPLSALLDERIAAFPVSGEINRRVEDAEAVIARIRAHYACAGGHIDTMDGLSIAFDDWRLNVRPSNTEPVLRLNVESRGNRTLMEKKRDEVLALIGGEPA